MGYTFRGNYIRLIVHVVFIFCFLFALKPSNTTLLNLYRIYKQDSFNKNPVWYVVMPMPQTLFTNTQGFFTEFLAVVGALVYAEKQNACGVIVDFTSDGVYSRNYGDNWWNYYFNSTLTLRNCIIPKDSSDGDTLRFDGFIPMFASFQSFIEGPNQKYRPYPLSFRTSPIKVAAMVKKFIKFTTDGLEIYNHVHAFLDKFQGYKIGLHFRGTDKKNVYPYSSPSFTTYTTIIDEIIRKEKKATIFVATDDSSFLEYIQQTYPEQVHSLITDIRLGKIPLHKNKYLDPKFKGDSAISDMLLLAGCNYIIKNRSSLSDVAIAFSNANFTMILSDDEVSHFSGSPK